jgi:hypothetical protein
LIAITFLMLCSWIVAARLSQKVLCQSLNAGATAPIAAPAKTNWLYLPVSPCAAVHLA